MSEKTNVRFQVDTELVEKFDEIHSNRSEALRSLMRRGVAKHCGGLESETLSKAYGVLLAQGDRYDNGAIRVVAPDVAPIIANQCNVEGGTEAVKGRIFAELRREGYIIPRTGYIWVKPEAANPDTWGNHE